MKLGLLALAAWFALSAAAFAAPGPATPLAGGWAENPYGAVRLIAGVNGTADLTSVPLGLEFRMAEGWKIYWRSAGDAGYPPEIDWSGSRNLAATTVSWPAPTRFSILGFETAGYERSVILPIDARLERPGEPLLLEASVDYLTCKEICVPQVARVSLSLPAGPPTPSVHASALAAARALVPTAPGADSPRIESLVLKAEQADVLQAVVRSPRPLRDADLFVEGPAVLAFGAPAVRFADGGRTAVFDVPLEGAADLGRPLVGETLTLTLTTADGAIEQRLAVSASHLAGGEAATSPLLWLLAIAWLGGLILNLMPCVLPVLSIKLLGVIRHGGEERGAIRLGFLASAAGIIVSFWVLAGALLAIKAAGGSVGWGLQFQQPWFLAAMTVIIVLFAGNLWGLFEVPLPRAIADAGAAAGHVRGLGGQFLTGALATVLATPCTAPFVGTAVGFALGGSGVTALAVFTAMALGLATPYLAVAAVPSLAQRLPRPGAWMLTVKRVLAVALLLTGGWLLMVLANHVGAITAAGVGALAALLLAAVAVRPRSPVRWRPALTALAVGAVGTALLLPTLAPRSAGGSTAATGLADHWAPFEPERIPHLVAAGKTVLVNVTADWCLTCKVNERAVLARPPVRDRLAAANVVAMQADWTRPNPMISSYLAGFGRFGIPFDAVYGPGLPQGEALPELLTPGIVIDALTRAAAGGPLAAAGQPAGGR